VAGEQFSCLWKLNRQRCQFDNMCSPCHYLGPLSKAFGSKRNLKTKGVCLVLHPPGILQNIPEGAAITDNITARNNQAAHTNEIASTDDTTSGNRQAAQTNNIDATEIARIYDASTGNNQAAQTNNVTMGENQGNRYGKTIKRGFGINDSWNISNYLLHEKSYKTCG
jgi:hypothetical protein